MPDTPAQQRITVPFAGHIIGQGVNSDTCDRVGTALNVGSEGEDKEADAQTAVFSFNVVTSQQSLESSMNIDAEIDARYLLFSGGAKFDFAQSNAVNSSSTYVLASCSVNNALRSGRNFTPTENASALLRAGDTDGFKRAFGDRFCEALRTGGEFHALVRVTSSNTTFQSNIAASLHGEMNGLAAAGSFKASFDEANKDTSSHTEVDIQIFQVGGQGNQITMPGADADKIREIMNGFAAAVHDHAQAFEAELVTYDTLALAGPSAMGLEDRREVLADCQARKQKYWSAISELEFLQTDDAGQIFADLPAATVLSSLENDFRRVLGALMDYALQVSTGAIPAKPFVPQNEPVLPSFARRNSTLFSQWWARRSDPDLLLDEQTLIHKIGSAAAHLLTVPLETASATAMQNAVNVLDTVDLSVTTPGAAQLHSIAELPQMLTPQLQKLTLSGNVLQNLHGIEPFIRLEQLAADGNKLTDISAVASVPGLKALQIRNNDVADISAIAGLTSLETLMLDGNQISTLDALANLHSLGLLILASSVLQSVQPNQPPPPTRIVSNPIVDGSALKNLPQIKNAFISADSIAVTFMVLPDLGQQAPDILNRLAAGEVVGEKVEGVATRVGNSTRFKFLATGAAQPENLTFAGILVGKGLDARSWVSILLDDRKKMGLASFDSAAPEQSQSIADFAKALAPNPVQLLGPALLGMGPDLLIEAHAQ